METDTQKMTAKIQALITKALDPGCTEAESESFMAAADRLMAKWQIDESMLRAAGGASKSGTLIQHIVTGITWPAYKERAMLWNAVCQNFDVVLLIESYTQGRKGCFYINGYDDDIDHVLFLAMQLELDMLHRAPKGHKYRVAFMAGYANTVHNRLESMRKTVIEETEGAGIMLHDKNARVKEFVGKTGKMRNKPTYYDSAGFRSGAIAGSSIDLGGTRVGRNEQLAIGR